MNYRRLGDLAARISEIGFGAWGLGGDAYGPIAEEDALATLRCAYEEGINFFDTADLYGNGRSEALLGKAFESCREEMVISTKVGFSHDGKDQDFSVAHIKRSIEQSLRRLRTDRVDVYFLHNPPMEALAAGEVLQTLEDLKRAGKARLTGVSVRRPQDGLEAIGKYGVRCVQVNLSMIDQRALECGLLALASKKGAGVIARTPLCFGFLAGKRASEIADDGTDHRSGWPKEQLEHWSRAAELFSGLSDGGKRSAVDAALQYCLSFDAVSAVIPGMMNADQVRQNAAASQPSKRLNAREQDRIKKIYEEYYSRPLAPKRL